MNGRTDQTDSHNSWVYFWLKRLSHSPAAIDNLRNRNQIKRQATVQVMSLTFSQPCCWPEGDKGWESNKIAIGYGSDSDFVVLALQSALINFRYK